ncbi:ATP-binding cassette domain-containing protein, partial [Candidatus Parvarchaeota archaeon]|nr:ATP-binding cassette domain-containing protein [Candidatus Parvarchaeota archaeon]
MTPLLHIQDLHVSADQKAILKGLSLTVKAGEIHALMGPNGSGKSTLAKVILGHPAYQITRGVVEYKGDDLAGKEVHERALNGIFLAFQNPKEIEGVNIEEFLLAAYRARQKHLS